MTDESKALPDWKPEDCRLPDAWIIAWCKGELTEEQGDLMCNHCSGCPECETRLCEISTPDIYAIFRLQSALSGQGEPIPPWTPEDGCVPSELLIAHGRGLLTERDRGLVSEHIAGCPKCEFLLVHRWGIEPRSRRRTLVDRLRAAAPHVTDDDLRRIHREDGSGQAIRAHLVKQFGPTWVTST